MVTGRVRSVVNGDLGASLLPWLECERAAFVQRK